MYVFDATPLIYLGKVDRLEIVEAVSARCVVPDPIHEEVVVAGRRAGHPDARRVGRAIEAETLSVVAVEETPTDERLCRNQHLSDADAAVLAVAADRDATAVVDEQYGRDVASAEGIDTRGTAYLVLSTLKNGVVDGTTAQATIDAMVEAGWYCSPALYARLSRKIETLSAPREEG
jgi:predicted nucleic acid-binding protein